MVDPAGSKTLGASGVHDAGEADSSRSFWLGFVGGWVAYLGINVFMIRVYEDATWSQTLAIGVANVAPLALVSTVVALNRRRLLRAEWSVLRTIGVHLVVGLLFAVASSAIAFGIIQAGGSLGEMAGGADEIRFGTVVISSLFLYVIFFGFLIWSESLRRVQESHRQAARESVLRAEAEARAIRAQFNPHFVFNTLHSLMLLVRADPGQAERAIEDVATLIRYASIIQRRDLDAVPLAKELEIARRYVALERLRLGDRLEVGWRIDLDPESVTVPAFTLQTLVENAIKHGIEPVPEGGRVEVTLRSDHETVSLTVRDDGRGARPEEALDAKGRGLDLLRGRLETRYGDRSSLAWETAPGEGFRVEVRLPAETPGPMPSLDVITERGSGPTRPEPAGSRG